MRREYEPRKDVFVSGYAGYIGTKLLTFGVGSFGVDTFMRVSPEDFYRGMEVLYTDKWLRHDVVKLHELELPTCDAIVHLAGEPAPARSKKSPVEVQMLNILGTHEIAEYARQKDIPHIVFASTMGVYGKLGGNIDENTEIDFSKLNEYQASKAVSENILKYYSDVYGIKATIFRIGVVYGKSVIPMEKDGKGGTVVNRFTHLALNGEPMTLYGGGTQRRPLIHLDDLCHAMRQAVVNPPPGYVNIYNAFTEQMTIVELAGRISAEVYRRTGRKSHAVAIPDPHNEPVLECTWSNDRFMNTFVLPRRRIEYYIKELTGGA